MSLPRIYLVRHGETPWTITRQHTGSVDLPLTAQGEFDAVQLKPRLKDLDVSTVLVSPLDRARRTCELCGFADRAEVEPDLAEWRYGDLEGLTREEIQARYPDWTLWSGECPGGESLQDVQARADRLVTRLRQAEGDVLLFSSGHLLRVLTARWLGLPPEAGRLFRLQTTSLSILGYEYDLETPIIQLWNDVRNG